jgi:hypothetical protein
MWRGLVAFGVSLFILSGVGALSTGAHAQGPAAAAPTRAELAQQKKILKKQRHKTKRFMKRLRKNTKRDFKRQRRDQRQMRQMPSAAQPRQATGR